MSGVTYAPVERLVEILGIALALKFAGRFGGRRTYLPQPERLKPEGPIVATVGYEAAVKLAHEWRGQEIMVPRCVSYLVRERARAIHADAKTLSKDQLALKYDITERYVFMILDAPAPTEPADVPQAPSAQRGLFSET
jgi:Mor family transcriptional regulator